VALSLYPQRVALPLYVSGAGALSFCFLSCFVGLPAVALGRGVACPVSVFVVYLSVSRVCHLGGWGSQGKDKPLSAWPRGSLCCVCVYFLMAFLLSPATSPPNNSALKAVSP
jgi:hypothetical protein